MLYMTYSSTITSKGTITLPAEFRKKYNLTQGEKVYITAEQGQLIIKRVPSLEEIRARAEASMKKQGKWPPPPYKTGDGFRRHVAAKYGKSSNV